MDDFYRTTLDLTSLRPGGDLFGFRNAEFIERSFVAAVRRFRSELLHELDGLASGRSSLQDFTVHANGSLYKAFRQIFELGVASVFPFHSLALSDMEILRKELFEQQRFLRAFGEDIAKGFFVMNPEARAALYLRALRGIFEIGRLEAYPGPYNWILGDTHHCEPCIAASVGGPYQKAPFSGLGIPVLPGIPGLGDICKGLTRCGCTVRPVSVELPNQDLQERMRDLLAEIVNG
jgi:hypothetical protein